jgi:hypothetical protein
LRAQYRARLAGESDLIRSWLHQGFPSRSAFPCVHSACQAAGHASSPLDG